MNGYQRILYPTHFEPDTYPEYIVMIAGAQEPTFLKYAGSGEWYRDGNFYKVIAWMPLPAPYKEN